MRMRCNFWIEVEGEVALSGWRVALLEAVEETGSISAAAGRLNVHFRVAWRKLQEQSDKNGIIRGGIVSASRNGAATAGTRNRTGDDHAGHSSGWRGRRR